MFIFSQGDIFFIEDHNRSIVPLEYDKIGGIKSMQWNTLPPVHVLSFKSVFHDNTEVFTERTLTSLSFSAVLSVFLCLSFLSSLSFFSFSLLPSISPLFPCLFRAFSFLSLPLTLPFFCSLSLSFFLPEGERWVAHAEITCHEVS